MVRDVNEKTKVLFFFFFFFFFFHHSPNSGTHGGEEHELCHTVQVPTTKQPIQLGYRERTEEGHRGLDSDTHKFQVTKCTSLQPLGPPVSMVALHCSQRSNQVQKKKREREKTPRTPLVPVWQCSQRPHAPHSLQRWSQVQPMSSSKRPTYRYRASPTMQRQREAAVLAVAKQAVHP